MTFGPLQMLVLEFDSAALKGEILPVLQRMRDAELIRLVDLLIVLKDQEGVVSAAGVNDPELDRVGGFGAIVSALIGLDAAGEDSQPAADDDVWYMADAIPPGTTAAVAIIEHLWAIPLRTAISNAGGVGLADEWIHPDDLAGLGLEPVEGSPPL